MKPSTPTRTSAPGVLPALPTLMLVIAVAAAFSADGKAASWRSAGCASLHLHLQARALPAEWEALPRSPQNLDRARRSGSDPTTGEKDGPRVPGPPALAPAPTQTPHSLPRLHALAGNGNASPLLQQAGWLTRTLNLPPPTSTHR